MPKLWHMEGGLNMTKESQIYEIILKTHIKKLGLIEATKEIYSLFQED
jgi:hypothetical protein